MRALVGAHGGARARPIRVGNFGWNADCICVGGRVCGCILARSNPGVQASANGHGGCVDLLITAGAKHLDNDSGNTPLHWAVQNKHIDLVKTLLKVRHFPAQFPPF